MWIQFKKFIVGDWKNLQKEVFLQAQALTTNSSSIPPPQHDLPIHKRMFRSLILGHANEYFWAICILAPFSFAPTSFDITLTFTTLHLESNNYFLLFPLV